MDTDQVAGQLTSPVKDRNASKTPKTSASEQETELDLVQICIIFFFSYTGADHMTLSFNSPPVS